MHNRFSRIFVYLYTAKKQFLPETLTKEQAS